MPVRFMKLSHTAKTRVNALIAKMRKQGLIVELDANETHLVLYSNSHKRRILERISLTTFQDADTPTP